MSTTPRIVTDVPLLPHRPQAAHKGTSGHVAIIAGSREMSGAAILTGLGALRGGAGLVRVLAPESVQPIIATHEPCLMTVPLPETKSGQISYKALKTVAAATQDWASVIAIGPGLGAAAAEHDDIHKLCAIAIGDSKVPVVVDADGLNAYAGMHPMEWGLDSGAPMVFTPHPGEMARLRGAPDVNLAELKGADDETRLRMAHEYAEKLSCDLTVVLKGYRTVVTTKEAAYFNTTGNPGMATGGMGDVLTGLIAALIAQGLDTFAASRLGVYVHGRAADHCSRQIGRVGYLAREVADAIPGALEEASQPRIGFV